MRITSGKYLAAVSLIFALNLFAEPTTQLKLPTELQKELPWFALVSEDGVNSYNGTFNLDNLRENLKPNTKRVAISLFATYCFSCREEFKMLRDRKAELEKNGVQVYMADVGEHDYEKAKEFARQYANLEFPLYFDPFGNVLADFGFVKNGNDAQSALPLIIILNEKLKPLKILQGKVGDDFPDVLWK